MASPSLLHEAEFAAPPSNEPYVAALVPARPTQPLEIVTALRTIGHLDGLTDEEYLWLATHGTERLAAEGASVFREGEPTERLHFMLRGEIHVRRRKSGPLAFFIGRAGSMTGLLPFSRMKTYGGDGYAVSPAWVLDLHRDHFPAMLAAIPSMAQRSVSVLLDRVREVTRMEQQAEKLSALGKLAANLAHELNNPASAAQRSAASLFGELRQFGEQKHRLGKLCLPEAESVAYQQWVTEARATMAAYTPEATAPTTPLAAADREDTLLRWLEAHHVPQAWTIAPALAETRLPVALLDGLAATLQPATLPIALATVASSLRVERLAETVVASTVRIFDLISAIKDYSYMDQAQLQEIDIAASLEATLTMFASRLTGIRVERDFDRSLPTIRGYGSELNQVWTVLVENALDAMAGATPGTATLGIVTHLRGQMAFIEVWDTGPGVDPALHSRIFEPFFTTKAPGCGLGLGLDTAQRIVSRHSGFLTVESKPTETCFQVRLPLDPAEAY